MGLYMYVFMAFMDICVSCYLPFVCIYMDGMGN